MPVRTQHCWPTTPNIVGCYMLRPFAHPVACCWMLLRVVGQSLKPVKLFSQQLPTFLLFRDPRSVAQQCWICLHSSFNIVGATHAHYARFTNTYGLYPSHDALQVPTLLAQQCWELLQPFAHSLRFVWCHGCHVNAHASHATIIIAFDSRAQVIQVHKYCTKWETFRFALRAWNLFTRENESRAWSQLGAGQVFGKIRFPEKSRNLCQLSLFRFHYSVWFLYFYRFPSMLRRLSSESLNKL